jgi:hypothetical protein
LLYWSAKVDLTNEIVNRLNAKYKADGGGASIGAVVPIDRDGARAMRNGPGKPVTSVKQ